MNKKDIWKTIFYLLILFLTISIYHNKDNINPTLGWLMSLAAFSIMLIASYIFKI